MHKISVIYVINRKKMNSNCRNVVSVKNDYTIGLIDSDCSRFAD